MIINIKKFKSNIMFFIVCISIIIIFLLCSFFVGNSSKLSISDLEDGNVDINKLVINEILTSNNGVISDEDGNLYDYVEIYNGSSKDINLNGYGLSDEGNQVKYTFPDYTLESKKYVVVKLTGKAKDNFSASFKLKSSGGETVTLFKPNGKVVDAVTTVALDSNISMARNTNGEWVSQDKPTPGFDNTVEGHAEFIASLVSKDERTIVINELLANNDGNFKNENGLFSGYIELCNVSDESINIANYSLSNSEDVSFKWQLPSIKLSPGEVTLIYTSGTSSKSGEISTSFKLKSKNGVAVLTNNKGKVIDKVEYTNLANGIALIRENDTMLENSSISPGYSNDLDGIEKFQKKYLSLNKELIINEVMSTNTKYLAQNGGKFYDWIELYNNSGNTVKLKDYCLTTNIDNTCMYNLPDVEVKENEYFVIMASGDTNLSNDKYYHSNFKISDSEGIYLTKSKDVVDSMFINNIPNGYSYGRGHKYGLYYFSTPTPLKENGEGKTSISFEPKSDTLGGVFNDKDSLTISLFGKNIYYTLDGSTPTSNSKKYSSPLTIKETTVLRIIGIEDGKINSDVVSYSYIMNDPHNVAVMSLVIDPGKLSNVNSHTALNSSVLEQCYVELFEKDGSGFRAGAGLKLFGGSTRSYKKKSYEIKFKKQFGSGKLNYKVFDTVDSSSFDSLVLRTGSQDEFQYNDQRTVIKDVVATSLMGEYTNVDVQAYKPIILYINGKYWGIYFIREKVDEGFISNHYNVQATETNSSILRIDGEVKIGTNKDYKSMISYITSNSLVKSSNYDKIKEQIDLESFSDFWVGEVYTANYDILNTRYFSSSVVDNGKWKWIFYDLDSGFFRTKQNTFTEYTSPSGMGAWNFPTTLLANMMKNNDFRDYFVERLSYNLNNTWKYENVSKRIDEVIDLFGKDEFERNAERWGNSFSHWNSSIKAFKQFAKERPSYVVSYAKSYFGLSDAEVKKYFGDIK